MTIESNTIPWLIFTQLLVLLLLLLLALLFFFAIFPFDPNHNDVVTADIPPATPSTSSNVFFFDDIRQIDLPTTRQQRTPQGGQNLFVKSEIATSPSIRSEENEIMEGEASSVYFHPCHYFELATVAFLKCFGLHSTSNSHSPSTRKHRKTKES